MSTPQTAKRQLPTVLVATLAIAATLVAVVALLPGRSTEASFTSSADAGFDVTASKPGGGKILALPEHKLALSPDGVLRWVDGDLGGHGDPGEEILRCGDGVSLPIDDIDGWVGGADNSVSTAYAMALDGEAYRVESDWRCLLPASGVATAVADAPFWIGHPTFAATYLMTLRWLPYFDSSVSGFEIQGADFKYDGSVGKDLSQTISASESTFRGGSSGHYTAFRVRAVLASGGHTAWSDVHAYLRGQSHLEPVVRDYFGLNQGDPLVIH